MKDYQRLEELIEDLEDAIDLLQAEEEAVSFIPYEKYGFWIWADRVDIPEDSVEYVNKIREQSDKKDLSDIITEVEGSE